MEGQLVQEAKISSKLLGTLQRRSWKISQNRFGGEWDSGFATWKLSYALG
jgi:hypothetical protein